MKTRLVSIFALILLVIMLIQFSGAITKNYESTSVSRIVGDSPDELISQLKRSDLKLEHSSYVEYPSGWNEIISVLEKTFAGAASYPGYKDIDDFILETFKNYPKELMVLDTEFINTADVGSWEGMDSKDLLILNSEYSGLYLPGKNTFAEKISPKSTLIAPYSYASSSFIKSFVCNLGKYEDIGETFRRARNNYYWNTDNHGLLGTYEYLGLTMLSYSLYGKPYLKVSVPSYDSSKLKSYCKDYLEEFNNQDYSTSSKKASLFKSQSVQASNSFSILSSSDQAYTNTIEFETGEYSIADMDNFSLLSTENTNLVYDNSEIMLPVKTSVMEFPLRTIITNLTVLEMSDSADFSANLPGWDMGFTSRSCYENNKSAGIVFSHAFTENSEVVIVRIDPVEVINCTAGSMRIYKHFKYKIEYLPYSPVRIMEITGPETAESSKTVRLSVSLENIQTEKSEGILKLKDQSNILATKEVSVSGGGMLTSSFDFNAPEYNGVKIFDIEFSQNNDSKTHALFSMGIIPYQLGNNTQNNQTNQTQPNNQTNQTLPNGCTPSTEICDGIDNDCDGEIDGIVRTADCIFGSCNAKIVQTCVNNAWTGECAPFEVKPETTYELCRDGLDNDCNGLIDMQDANCKPPVNTTSCSSGKKCSSGTECRGKGTNDCCYGFCMPKPK